MEAGASATIVAAIIAGAVALAVAFRKSAITQWQRISRARKVAVIFLSGVISGMLTAALAPDEPSAIVAGIIICTAVGTLIIFLGKHSKT